MHKTANKKVLVQAFTLVELLVVITILAIISVVAYQNFG
ncbi:MAG: prepilin-type N-terminal cleavage/methylation domain-containing protein [bacterium]|nr:prepilin-type N-terminal cleavage/methylation domain-containing protein [bacterium]MDP3381266.1 prepilin-type N-terminal cleavage/methylation domain-containing protein [bacterium]